MLCQSGIFNDLKDPIELSHFQDDLDRRRDRTERKWLVQASSKFKSGNQSHQICTVDRLCLTQINNQTRGSTLHPALTSRATAIHETFARNTRIAWS